MRKLFLFLCVVLVCQLAGAANKWPDRYVGGDEKLFYDQETIEAIRARIDTYAWADKLYHRLKAELADPEAEKYRPLPGLSPRSYQGRWTRDAALCYRIDGDETHIPQVVKNIVGYFKLNKPNEPRFDHDTTKLWRNFWEWGWYSTLNLAAYDLIKNHPQMLPYRKVMNQRIREILDEGKRYYRRISRIGNTHFWGVTTMGLYGFMAGDQEAVDWAINGPKGFKSYFNQFRDNGHFVPEPLAYTFGYVDCCMTLLAEAARKNNYPEDLYFYEAPNGASMQRMLVGFLQSAAPNGFGFDNGDGGVRQAEKGNQLVMEHTPILSSFGKISRTNQKWEIYNSVYRTPELAWAVAQNPKRDDFCFTFWGYSALTYGQPIDAKHIQAPDARSVTYPEMGNAFIKSVQGADYWWSKSLVVHMRNGASQQFHSHNDHFSFTLTAFDKFIYMDHALHWDYLCPRPGRANYTPITPRICNHNTVVVDCQEPDVSLIKYSSRKPEVPGARFSEIHQQGPMQRLSCEGSPYGGVKQKRTFYVTKEYVLDVFALQSDVEHIYDYLLHATGKANYAGVGEWNAYPQLAAEYQLREIDEKSKRDDRWWLMNTKIASAVKEIAIDILDTDKIGVHTTVLHEPNTQLITTEQPTYVSCAKGWDGTYPRLRHPMTVVRRNAKSTTFVALHEPYQQKLAKPLKIERRGDIVTIKGAKFVDTYNLATGDFSRR